MNCVYVLCCWQKGCPRRWYWVVLLFPFRHTQPPTSPSKPKKYNFMTPGNLLEMQIRKINFLFPERAL